MLKLSNSFSRYLRVTCERVNCNANAKLTNFSGINSTSTAYWCQTRHRYQHLHYRQQTRLYTNANKNHHIIRQLLGTDDTKENKQMTDPLRPTLEHTSYGGHFEMIPNEGPYLKGFQNSNLVNGSRVNCRIPADFRVWEPVEQKTDGSQRFTVLSYNMLAQYLLECHPYLYTDCSPHNLKWKVRAAKLYEEILSLSPDILCLQEVQASHLNSFYSKFERIGYFGIFKRKTGHRQDGCAIYFKQAMFELQDHVSVEYYQPQLAILNRDNIGVMVKLVPKCAPKTPIVVVTTHLLYNPKRTDVRLAQMQVLLAEIDRFAFSSNGNHSCHLPIIMTGDFNSTPDSAVVQLLDHGQVIAASFRDNSDWLRIGVTDNCQHLTVYLNRAKGQHTDFSMTSIYNSEYSPSLPGSSSGAAFDEHKELFNSNIIAHSLPLTSVYNKMKEDGNSEATTYADYWVTVDYIYFSNCSALKLVERLRLPTSSECEVLGRMPNDVYGSDHLALAATFEISL